MNNEFYLPVIVALLPLVACLLVVQVNPYHALVIRGVLGAVAALVDALLGAADVALTEALVGTMLAITLYAVAVRSSLVLHLGVVKDHLSELGQLMDELRPILNRRHLRLELISYSNSEDLEQGLLDKEVHAICTCLEPINQEKQVYHTQTRIKRIFEILQSELSSPEVKLSYVSRERVPDPSVPKLEEKH